MCCKLPYAYISRQHQTKVFIRRLGRHEFAAVVSHICAGGLRCLRETETIAGRPDAASRRTFCLFVLVLVLAACACACSGWPPGFLWPGFGDNDADA